jgi:tetratricopeptide (TPR) repeat protein
MARRLGLIIGVNQYQDPTFRPLQAAESDAQAIAQWLVNTKGGKWAPGNVQHVEGAYATRELVESLVTQLCTRVAEPGDLILIYFAGHAFVDERSGAGLLALPNTQYQNPETGIHVASLLQKTLLRSRAAHVVLILDCFQTGKAWNAQRTSPYDSRALLGPQLYAALQNTPDRFIICSCRGNDFAPEQTQRNLGLFAYQLIVGFSGPVVDPATGIITLQQTYNYLLSTTGEQQRPQLFGREQSPTILVGDLPDGDNMPFSKAVTGKGPAQSPMQPGMAQSAAANASFAAATMSRPDSGPLQMNEQSKQRYNQLMNVARQLLQAQRFPDAFAAVEQALQIAPNDLPALILKAQILGIGGRTQDAFATIEQVMRIDQNNATAWSTYAQLLGNSGQMQQALEAIERSLALDPQNPEAYVIKNDIMGQLAMIQSNSGTLSSRLSPLKKQPTAKSTTYLLVFGLQLIGLLVGTGGILLLELQHRITSVPGLLLITLGLLFLSFNAWRATSRYGFASFIPIIVASLLSGAILGAVYKFGLNRVNAFLKLHPTFFMPLPFIEGWLVAATVIPLLVALIGFAVSSIMAKRRA